MLLRVFCPRKWGVASIIQQRRSWKSVFSGRQTDVAFTKALPLAHKRKHRRICQCCPVSHLLWKIVQVSTSFKFVEKIVKFVKKYAYIPSNMFRKQRVAQYWAVCTSVDSAWANIKDYSSSTLSLVTGPRGSVKRVWKSIWWWKSESGLTKYENM